MTQQMKITNVFARRIIDSRGFPTIEVDIALDNKFMGRAAVPSGASKGEKEALELRDNDAAFHGKDVKNAIKNVNTVIKSAVINKTFSSQKELDQTLINLDNTENKSNLGANAILGVSLAFAKASASANNIPLFKIFGNKASMPIPFINVINGGAHADNLLDIQEFMIVPHGISPFSKKIQAACEVFQTLKKLVKLEGYSTNVGDEGGFAPNLQKSSQALDLISRAITEAGYKVGSEISLALDVAANEIYTDGKYLLKGENLTLDSQGFCHYLEQLCNEYPIISVEDPMMENDYKGWEYFTKLLGDKIQIVGDDIFVTNPKLIRYGADHKIANSVLIKPNQIGTLTETIEAINTAKELGYKCIISHRSGETEDTTIAHLAVGMDAGQIKTGSMSRSDRTCKYNELLRIEEII